MRYVLPLLAILLTACPPKALPQDPQMVQAVQIAWSYYKLPGKPPTYVLMQGAALTCRNSPGTEMVGWGCKGVVHPGCTCVAGTEDGASFAIARVDNQPWHTTAICHEAQHAAVGNYNHTQPAWDNLLLPCQAAQTAAGL